MISFADIITSRTIIAAITDMAGNGHNVSGLARWASAGSTVMRRRACAAALIIRRHDITSRTIIGPITYMAGSRHNVSSLIRWARRGCHKRPRFNASSMAGIAQLTNFNVTRWADTEILTGNRTNLTRWAGRGVRIAYRSGGAVLVALIGFRKLVTSPSII